MAIWGIERRKRDSWAIRSENANLGEFERREDYWIIREQEKVVAEKVKADLEKIGHFEYDITFNAE